MEAVCRRPSSADDGLVMLGDVHFPGHAALALDPDNVAVSCVAREGNGIFRRGYARHPSSADDAAELLTKYTPLVTAGLDEFTIHVGANERAHITRSSRCVVAIPKNVTSFHLALVNETTDLSLTADNDLAELDLFLSGGVARPASVIVLARGFSPAKLKRRDGEDYENAWTGGDATDPEPTFYTRVRIHVEPGIAVSLKDQFTGIETTVPAEYGEIVLWRKFGPVETLVHSAEMMAPAW